MMLTVLGVVMTEAKKRQKKRFSEVEIPTCPQCGSRVKFPHRTHRDATVCHWCNKITLEGYS